MDVLIGARWKEKPGDGVRYYWTCDCDCFLDGVSYGTPFRPHLVAFYPLYSAWVRLNKYRTWINIFREDPCKNRA